MMATEKKTARQKKLDRIIVSIAGLSVLDTYEDEQQARDHLRNAMEELKLATECLIDSES